MQPSPRLPLADLIADDTVYAEITNALANVRGWDGTVSVRWLAKTLSGHVMAWSLTAAHDNGAWGHLVAPNLCRAPYDAVPAVVIPIRSV